MKVKTDSFRFDKDPRFVDLEKKVAVLEGKRNELNTDLVKAAARQRRTQSEIENLSIKVLLGQATEKEVNAAREERDQIDQQMTELRAAFGIIREQLAGVQAARATLEAELRADCRRRAMAAYRVAVDRLKPLLLQAAEVNRDLSGIFEFVNVPGVPGPVDGLALNHDRLNTPLGYWLTAAETFKWEEYGA